jgi:hypothetical protein
MYVFASLGPHVSSRCDGSSVVRLQPADSPITVQDLVGTKRLIKESYVFTSHPDGNDPTAGRVRERTGPSWKLKLPKEKIEPTTDRIAAERTGNLVLESLFRENLENNPEAGM